MTENLFDYVLDRVSITALISQYTELRTRGRNTTGLCPFHSEKTPSFSVSEEKGLYHCFGCQKSGNALTFICEKENLDSYDGIRMLADRFGIDISAFDKNKERGRSEERNALREILRYAAVFFRKHLASSAMAQEYLAKRGVDGRIAQKYGIGYAPDRWDALYQVFRKRYPEKQLLEAGLLSQSDRGTYDRFRNRLMFPIVDQRNRFVGFGGRVFGDEKPKYLNSPESTVFQKSELLYALNIAKDHLGVDRQIIVTEGYMDVIGLARSGIYNAVATLGTALTTQHAKLLARYTQNVVLCYDSDEAGRAAALKGIDVLVPHIGTIRVVRLPEGDDPDEYVAAHGVEAFQARISEAMRALEYKIARTAEQYDLRDPHEKARFLQTATEWIKSLQPFEKENYIDFLSKQYNVDQLLIRRQVGNLGVATSSAAPRERAKLPADRKLKALECEIISEFTKHYRLLPPETILEIAGGEFTPGAQELLTEIMAYYAEDERRGTVNLVEFAETYGMERAKSLEAVLRRYSGSDDGGGMHAHLIRHRLARVDYQLAQMKSKPEDVQEILAEKKRLIEALKSHNRKGATRIGK